MLIAEFCDNVQLTFAELKYLDTGDLLQTECAFKILVDGRLFFQDDYFPILEFTRYALTWLKNPSSDFIYNTAESDMRPILSFSATSGGWKLFSVWQKFKSTKTYCFDEVKNFIEQVANQVIKDGGGFEKAGEDTGRGDGSKPLKKSVGSSG